MHGTQWHDHAEPHDMDRVRHSRPAAMEAVDERQGMGKHVGRNDKGSTRVNQSSPRGKGTPGIKKQHH